MHGWQCVIYKLKNAIGNKIIMCREFKKVIKLRVMQISGHCLWFCNCIIYLFVQMALFVYDQDFHWDICNNCLFEFYILHTKDAYTMDTILAHFLFFSDSFSFLFSKNTLSNYFCLLLHVMMILFVLLCTSPKIDQR